MKHHLVKAPLHPRERVWWFHSCLPLRHCWLPLKLRYMPQNVHVCIQAFPLALELLLPVFGPSISYPWTLSNYHPIRVPCAFNLACQTNVLNNAFTFLNFHRLFPNPCWLPTLVFGTFLWDILLFFWDFSLHPQTCASCYLPLWLATIKTSKSALDMSTCTLKPVNLCGLTLATLPWTLTPAFEPLLTAF